MNNTQFMDERKSLMEAYGDAFNEAATFLYEKQSMTVDLYPHGHFVITRAENVRFQNGDIQSLKYRYIVQNKTKTHRLREADVDHIRLQSWIPDDLWSHESECGRQNLRLARVETNMRDEITELIFHWMGSRYFLHIVFQYQ